MVIDNSNMVIKDRKLMYLLAIGLIIITSVVAFSGLFTEPILGIKKEYYVIFFCLLYIAINVFRFIRDYNYINYNDDSDKITIKYYTLRPFMLKRRTIEIPKNSFNKFEIVKSNWGLKKHIVLYQRVKSKIAKYPPISISALNKEETDNLILALQAHSNTIS
jgi:hypothetical protein